MHRFFISQLDHITDEQLLVCSDYLINQFIRVLRFNAGEKIVAFDGSGHEWGVELTDLSVKKIIGRVFEKRLCETELPVRLVIACAILKNMERFEFVLQKGTELGVSAFVPLITDRTERKVLGKTERLQRILKEAAEQSGRGKVPELLDECKFEKFLGKGEGDEDSGRKKEEGNPPAAGLIIVPHPGAVMKFSDLMKKCGKISGEIVVCVGPEGGFTEREIKIAEESGAQLISLGPRILRAETVPLVVATMVGEWV